MVGPLAQRINIDKDLIWRGRAKAGDWFADHLANLVEHGDISQGWWTRVWAAAGDRYAAGHPARLLAERGDLDGLRALADAGDGDAAGHLARLLAERGDLGQAEQIWRARANVGDGNVERLAEVLTRQGRGEEAERLLRFGLAPDGSTASG